MGRILALGKGADEDRGWRSVHEALGSDSARRGRGRENGKQGASLEDMGKISAPGNGGYDSASALRVGCEETGKGAGLSPI